MKKSNHEDIIGYGTRVFVSCEKNGKAADETTIEIDFSQSSFPDIEISAIDGKIKIHSFGAIEQGEIIEALELTLKMLKL